MTGCGTAVGEGRGETLRPTIAYLTNYFPSLTETFIYREVVELKRRGFDIVTYSLRKPSITEVSAEALGLYESTYYLLPARIPAVVRSHLGYVGTRPLTYAAAAFKMITGTHKHWRDRVRSLMHFGEGVAIASKIRNDHVVHIHAHYASQAASVARAVHLLTGIPYSFTGHAHDIWHDRLLLPEKLREARFVVTCSEAGKEALCNSPPDGLHPQVHVVYHGIDVDEFPWHENPGTREKNLILSFGRFTGEKGFPDLIRACAIMKAWGFPFRCTIVGEGEERETLRDLVASLHLSHEVNLAGAVPQERIREFYRRAWIFALPCVDTPDGNRDGIPNVLMEAMAMGVPVITTGNSGQPELIEDRKHGFMVAAHAPEELARTIMSVCHDGQLHRATAKEARKRIEQMFDSRKTIQPLIALFREHVV